jgi:hypothetical protein
VLSGCAGRDFVRPAPETFRNGQTSYSEIMAKFGPPFREGTVIKNDKTVKTLGYAYASVGGRPHREGVTPARAMGFYFSDDVLVGHEFLSSWAEDHSDFDEGKVKDIVKGKTTRAEVIALLGKPAGYYIYPMIKASPGDAAAYVYSETRGSAFNLRFYRKLLLVTLDATGVVSDVEFTASGMK